MTTCLRSFIKVMATTSSDCRSPLHRFFFSVSSLLFDRCLSLSFVSRERFVSTFVRSSIYIFIKMTHHSTKSKHFSTNRFEQPGEYECAHNLVLHRFLVDIVSYSASRFKKSILIACSSSRRLFFWFSSDMHVQAAVVSSFFSLSS